MAVILALFPGSKNLMACHEEASGGDRGIWPTLRGHSPTSRQSGILVTFEGTSASISTTTNCDAYTHFIELNYDQIANNAAQGQGPYLDALASLRGCSDDSRFLFSRVIHANFSKLFKNSELRVEILNYSLDIILNREPLLLDKCQIPPKSAFS
ncbi:MAG: DUF3015 family protein [SAR324 cluster bacterium]|nr:DUF3015 family protein [SAR324 cluster bacterium]